MLASANLGVLRKKELYLSGSGTSNPQSNIIPKADKLHLSSIAPAYSLALVMPGAEHIVRWHWS